MTQIATVQTDAREFGIHIKQGGWRLGLLVARNVSKGNDRAAQTRQKISAREFAKLAGTTHDRVLRYLDAWELAADAGLVPHAAELTPGHSVFNLDVVPPRDWDEFYPPSEPGYLANADPVTRERIKQAAQETGTTPAQIARFMASPKAVEAAIAVSPKVREAAGRGLDKHYDRELAERRIDKERIHAPSPSTQDDDDRAVEIMVRLRAISREIRRATDTILSGPPVDDFGDLVASVDWQINALGIIRSALAGEADLDAVLAEILKEV